MPSPVTSPVCKFLNSLASSLLNKPLSAPDYKLNLVIIPLSYPKTPKLPQSVTATLVTRPDFTGDYKDILLIEWLA
jgi:hypothetical protein